MVHAAAASAALSSAARGAMLCMGLLAHAGTASYAYKILRGPATSGTASLPLTFATRASPVGGWPLWLPTVSVT